MLLLVMVLTMAKSALATNLEWNFKFNTSEVTLSPKGDFTRISLSDCSDPCDVIGAPAIPAKYANILLPNGATDVKVSASGDLVLLASDVTPWPVQPQFRRASPCRLSQLLTPWRMPLLLLGLLSLPPLRDSIRCRAARSSLCV